MSRCSLQKKRRAVSGALFFRPLQDLPLTETFAAVDGAIVAGLERNLAGLTAGGANSVVHLTAGAAGLLASVAACLAAQGLIGETLLRVKFLFTGGEDELLTAVFADECLVVVHEIPL